MPTKRRMDLAVYHHILNRGVKRCNVFNHTNDKGMFLTKVLNRITIGAIAMKQIASPDP